MATIDKEKAAGRLRERAEEIEQQLASLRREGDGRDSELADYDQHPGDQGTEMHDQELDASREQMLDLELEQVKVAQQRLDEGSYGTCIDCGKDIPEARLEAIPEAIRCIEDQERYEAHHRAAGPPRSGP